MWRPRNLFTWNFETRTSPVVGTSAASRSRMNVDLPEPDGPIRKTNSPLSILTLTSSNAGRADDLYCLLTWSSVIITARQCSGDFRWVATLTERVATGSGPDRAPAEVAAPAMWSELASCLAWCLVWSSWDRTGQAAGMAATELTGWWSYSSGSVPWWWASSA